MAVFCRADQRRRHIDQMWAPDGRLAVSSLGLTIEGVDDINAHISQVHDDLISDKGLAFTTNTSSPATACCCAGRCSAERRELTELLKRLIAEAPAG
jgi:hypothetical protein